MSSFILNNASSFLKSNNARIPLPIIQRSTNNCLKHSFTTNTKGAAPFSHLFLTTTTTSSSSTTTRKGGHHNPSCRDSSDKGRTISSTTTFTKSSSIMSSNTLKNQDHLSGEEPQSMTNTQLCINNKNNKNSNNNNNTTKKIPSTQNVIEIDIISYLASIENELLQSFPKNHSFQVKIRPQNRRPMIRRLLGIESKDEFYHLCRTVRAILEYERMYHFVFVLRDEMVHGHDLNYIHDKLPSFQHAFDELTSQYEQQQQQQQKSQSESSSNTTQDQIIHNDHLIKKGIQPFNRLASGRDYKGKLMDMVQDLTPHLSNQCEDAMTPLTDAQVLLEVIDLIARSLDINTTTKTSSLSTSLILPTLIQTTVNERCINAAKECVFHLHDLNNTQEDDDTMDDDNDNDENHNNNKNGYGSNDNNGNNIQTNYLPKLNGLECEQACITYLEEVLNESYKQSSEDMPTTSTTSILQNVLVNHKSTQSRSKYSKGNMRNNQGGWRNVVTSSIHGTTSTNAKDNEMDLSNSDPTSTSCKTVTGILWTNSGSRENICSEFDALVVHNSILQQQEKEGGEEMNEKEEISQCRISEFWEAKYSVSPSSLHDAITKKLSAIRSVVNDDDVTISYNGNHYIMGENKGVTKFGLFGMELLSPANAIGQLRSTAASYALTNSVDAALEAAETGFVQVKVDYLQRHIYGLKDALSECDDFEIIVRIVK